MPATKLVFHNHYNLGTVSIQYVSNASFVMHLYAYKLCCVAQYTNEIHDCVYSNAPENISKTDLRPAAVQRLKNPQT